MESMERQQSQVLNTERVQKLETWVNATNTQLTQVQGQRKYGGPPEVWDGPTPGARCEVFISQIPRDTFEDVLIPLFSSVGPLWEFRLMMNFSGQNRGFAYAKYGSSAFATEAIHQLHGLLLEPGCFLSVRHSTEKRHICVRNLPATTQQDKLLQALRAVTEGVVRVSLKTGPGIEGANAIVAFSSHHSASMAKKVLVEAFKKQFGMTISVKWLATVKPNMDGKFSKPSVSLPPRLACPPFIPPGFCRAVGGPTAPQNPSCFAASSSSFQEHLVSAAASGNHVMLLRSLCETAGYGQPLYDLCYRQAGPDGFLHFTYTVCFTLISLAFKGMVPVLPGPTLSCTLEEAQQAAAQQVMHRICQIQLTR